MKVPIEADDEQNRASGDAAQAAKPVNQTGSKQGATKEAAAQPLDAEAEHQRMVDAAIKAGEQAAEEDFKTDASRLRKERDELSKKLANVSDEIDKAKADAANSADRLARLQADWDNYRRRTAGEREDERSRATEKLVLNLLPVIDDLERAVAHAQASCDDDANLSQFVDGVQAVHTKMIDVLSKEGVEVINPVDEPFEPLSHQAVGRVEDKDVYDETVRDVYQMGYRMGGKVIRPAMVTVTCGGKKRPVEKPDEDSSKSKADGAAKGTKGKADAPGKDGTSEGR